VVLVCGPRRSSLWRASNLYSSCRSTHWGWPRRLYCRNQRRIVDPDLSGNLVVRRALEPEIARVDLTIRFSQESVSAPALLRFFFFFKKAARSRPSPRFWPAVPQSWPSREFCFSTKHRHGSDCLGLCLRLRDCFCCASESRADQPQEIVEAAGNARRFALVESRANSIFPRSCCWR